MPYNPHHQKKRVVPIGELGFFVPVPGSSISYETTVRIEHDTEPNWDDHCISLYLDGEFQEIIHCGVASSGILLPVGMITLVHYSNCIVPSRIQLVIFDIEMTIGGKSNVLKDDNGEPIYREYDIVSVADPECN